MVITDRRVRLGLHCYPTDVLGVDWYACEDCSALIQNED